MLAHLRQRRRHLDLVRREQGPALREQWREGQHVGNLAQCHPPDGAGEQAQIELVRQLIRKKKFAPFRVNNTYPVAIDGTQKLVGSELWHEALLQRRTSSSDEEPVRYRYSVYVLEANLSFRNGIL